MQGGETEGNNQEKCTNNFLVSSRFLVIGKEKTSIQGSHNKANLVDNEPFGPQNILINTDSRGRSKVELKT